MSSKSTPYLLDSLDLDLGSSPVHPDVHTHRSVGLRTASILSTHSDRYSTCVGQVHYFSDLYELDLSKPVPNNFDAAPTICPTTAKKYFLKMLQSSYLLV